jgi:hypothetical protein
VQESRQIGRAHSVIKLGRLIRRLLMVLLPAKAKTAFAVAHPTPLDHECQEYPARRRARSGEARKSLPSGGYFRGPNWLQRRIVLRSAHELICDLKRGSRTVLTKKEVWYEAGLTRLHTNSLYRTLGLC